jgi:hypothetical protein
LLEETEDVAVNKHTFSKLVTALRTAVAIKYKRDNEQPSYGDLLEGFLVNPSISYN